MDAGQDLVEQNSTEMRHEIDTTRSEMADKLEALEDRMIGAAQSAQATVEDSIQSAKDAVASVKRTFDIKHQVEQRPWTIVGGSFLAGPAVSLLIPKGRPGPFKPFNDNGHAEDEKTEKVNPDQPLAVRMQPASAFTLDRVAGSTAEFLATAVLIVVLVVFMLIQREELRDRLVQLVGPGRLIHTTRAVEETARSLSRFLLMQFVVNASVGLIIGVGRSARRRARK